MKFSIDPYEKELIVETIEYRIENDESFIRDNRITGSTNAIPLLSMSVQGQSEWIGGYRTSEPRTCRVTKGFPPHLQCRKCYGNFYSWK